MNSKKFAFCAVAAGGIATVSAAAGVLLHADGYVKGYNNGLGDARKRIVQGCILADFIATSLKALPAEELREDPVVLVNVSTKNGAYTPVLIYSALDIQKTHSEVCSSWSGGPLAGQNRPNNQYKWFLRHF